jgi:hypothetical protein
LLGRTPAIHLLWQWQTLDDVEHKRLIDDLQQQPHASLPHGLPTPAGVGHRGTRSRTYTSAEHQRHEEVARPTGGASNMGCWPA